MRVGLDATPLLGRPTGVGRYVSGLLGGLCALAEPPELVLTAFTVRSANALPQRAAEAGAGSARVTRHRLLARALHATWRLTDFPPVETLTGRIEVFHGTNFVLPPMRRAGGVVTVHDLTYERHPDLVSAASRSYRELVPRALRSGALVLTPSQVMADEVGAHYGVDRWRVRATGLGVDRAWFETAPPTPAERVGLGLPERYILFVGNREPRKNLPVLLRAHAALRAEDSDAPPLVLVGPPGWGDAADLSASGVVVAGYLDDAHLRLVTAGAACLAFPSRYEGFGLPPLEALASGVPVVASDLPVLREVLGEHARFAAVGCADALAEGLRQTLTCPPAPEAGRAWAARWTWQRCAEATLSAYDVARHG